MVETTPPGPSTTPPPQPPPPASAQAGAPAPPEAERPPTPPLTVRTLLEAGVHFGHQTRRWNPRMKPYLFGERNGIHIIDLDKTIVMLREALDFLRDVVAAGGKVLLVGTKPQAREMVKREATRAGQFYVNNRWLGGTLTNFRTVKKSIDHYKQHLELVADEEKVAELSKKELARVNRELERYRKALEGIREMSRLPDALFVIDVNRERIAVSEAQRLGIPIVAVVDSNCDPEGIDYVIPGNDDAARAIDLYCRLVADACLEGAELYNERVQAEATAAPEQQAAAPTTGRRVVEIKQPPRRGRSAGGGARSAGGRRSGPREGGGPRGGEAPETAAAPESKTPPAGGDAGGES